MIRTLLIALAAVSALAARTGAQDNLPGNRLPIRVGCDSQGGSLFRGEIGLVRIWRRRLSAHEIRVLAGTAPASTATGKGLAVEWLLTGKPLPVTVEPKPGLALRSEATVEAWVNPAAENTSVAGGGRIVDRITAGGSDGWLLDAYPGSSLRVMVGSETRQFSVQLKPGAWRHIAATLSTESGPELYLDGKPLTRSEPPSEPGVTFHGAALGPGKPLTLWYRRPAAVWTQALVLGNGRIGGMLFGGVRKERVALNEDTLWSGEPADTMPPRGREALPEVRRLLLAGRNREAHDLVARTMLGPYFQSYLPLGDLNIDFGGVKEAAGYRRDLDLTTGIARVRYRTGGADWVRECFVSHPAQALVYRVLCGRRGGLHLTASLATQLHGTQSADGSDLLLSGRAPSFLDAYTGKPTVYGDGGMRFEVRLRAVAEGGRVSVTDRGISVSGANAVTFILVTATSYNGPRKNPGREGRDPARLNRKSMADALRRPYPRLLSEHEADFSGLMNRVSIDLGKGPAAVLPTDERIRSHSPARDPGLPALYFQFGRYLLASGSRPGTMPLNLQGIWNDRLLAPWASNWTLNCNAEINYWPVEAANLSECHLPLIDLARGISVDGARVARELYGARGWMTHHNADIWMRATPVAGDPVWSIFQVGGAWLCRHAWEHYAFTRDRSYLAGVYPLMRGACLYFLDSMLAEPTHGWLVTAPATNFESYFRKPGGETAAVCMGPTADMQMVRQLFDDTLAAGRILGGDAGFRAELAAARAKLPPMMVSPRTGELQEWLEDWDHATPGSGQILSTWGLICGDQIVPDRDREIVAALRKSIEDRKPWNTWVGSWTGAFMSNAFARLWEGDWALEILRKHLNRCTNPNLTASFEGMSDWQIDGNMGQTAAVCEMLLQSHAGYLHLLPALPRTWQNGSVRGLRGRGGYEIDMAWAGGRLKSAVIRSAYRSTCRVRGIAGMRILRNGRPVATHAARAGLITFEAEAGVAYRICLHTGA